MNSKTGHMTLSDYLIPVESQKLRFLKDIILIIGFSMIMGISAQIRINLGFTPVPITSQTLVVLITGALLGSKRGAAVMLLYLLEGAIFPVFSNGSSGFFWQLSTGGYLLGFIPAAFIIGYLVERGWSTKPWILPAMLLGNIIIYIPGLIVLSLWVPEGKTLEYGLLPFIPGDLIKIILASILIPIIYTKIYNNKG